MIAPNKVVLTTDPHRSTVDALLNSVEKNGPSGAPNDSVARTPATSPNITAYTLNSAVTIINAKNRGTTRFLTGSTPNTCNASSSSRIFLAPRSAVIAVPATPASTIASTNGANSRIDANTKNPPRRSNAPNNTRKFAACRPGAPYPNATVETNSGNQHSFRANRNWLTNSPPYGYGGLRADMIVLPVRIIMSPTSSSRFLTGKNPRSATLRTKCEPPSCDPGHEAYVTPGNRANNQPSSARICPSVNEVTRKIWRGGTFPRRWGWVGCVSWAWERSRCSSSRAAAAARDRTPRSRPGRSRSRSSRTTSR